jgi:hypothetical protein
MSARTLLVPAILAGIFLATSPFGQGPLVCEDWNYMCQAELQAEIAANW